MKSLHRTNSLHRPGWTNIFLAALIGWTIWALASFFLLSALGLLSGRGYLISGVIFCIPAVIYLKSISGKFRLPGFLPWRRILYPPLLLWFVIAFAILVGSVIHPPSNYDAFSYRVPRMLHWLAESRWHWINGPDSRYDFMAPLWEINALPLLALSGSDRLLFLPNFLCFLVLPGLIFTTFLKLGISPRTSRLCMWVLPSGYAVILQAGSLGSDLMGAVFFLVSLHFLLRWPKEGKNDHFLLSCITMGFSTATKVSNLVFGLPWLLLLLPQWPLLRQKKGAFLACLVLGAFTSFLPFGAWNVMHGSGFAVSKDSAQSIAAGSPPICLFGNSILFLVQNAAPPVFPLASKVQDCVDKVIPPAILTRLQDGFEGKFELGVRELVTEDVAGLGVGVTGFILILFLIRLTSSGNPFRDRGSQSLRLLGIGMAGAIAVIFMKTSMISISRILLPAYIPVAAVLVNGAAITRYAGRRWVVFLACAAQLSGLCVLALNPARPLIPVIAISRHFLPDSSPLRHRLESVYTTFAGRSTALTPVAEALPPDVKIISFVYKADTLETGLWKPFGSRKVTPVKAKDALRAGYVFPTRYVVVQERGVIEEGPMGIDDFLRITKLITLRKVSVIQQVSSGPENFIIAEVPGFGDFSHDFSPKTRDNPKPNK